MSQKTIIKTLKTNNTFLISTHVNPDADALASELVLSKYLKGIGKKVDIVNVDKVPKMFSFMPGVRRIKRLGIRKRPYDVAIVVDCGNLKRILEVKNLIGQHTVVINIDHHITNDFFGDLNLVKPEASSTAEVVYDLLKTARCKMTKKMAELLYVGIMTDTGSFRYDNTTSYTHTIASELLQFKLPVNAIYKDIYERIPANEVKHFMKSINSFELLNSGKIACVTLHKKKLALFSGAFDVRDRIFTFLRAINGVEVIAIFTQRRRGATRVNFRSQGKTNVASIASFFGGGGHRKASGCSIANDIKTAKRKVLSKLKDTIK